jgi:drug/metabolite transporter (DMT)-like permease
MERIDSAGDNSQGNDTSDGEDNLGRGNDPFLQALLEEDKEEYDTFPIKQSEGKSSHRKVQSMWEIPTGGPKVKGRHHRHRSSISQLFSSLTTIGEEMVSEGRLLRDSWQGELQDAKEGKTFFLDMTLSRSLSILPEELPLVVEETTGQHIPLRAEHPEPPVSKYGPFVALLAAVLAVSSNGSALSLLRGVAAPLKLYWRMTATYLVFLPFALRIMYRSGGLPRLTVGQWITFFGAAFSYTGHALLYVFALEYTSIGNVVIGANSQAILLVLGKLLMGQTVLKMEASGVLIAFLGCVLCSADEAKESDDNGDAERSAFFGDILALTSGAFGVAYLTFAKAVRKEMPVTVFMFLVMVSGSLMVLTFMLCTHSVDVSVSRNPYSGLFGWISISEHRLFVLIHIAIVCNVIGTTGFIRAMQHFDNIVIAVATLLEPMIATLIAFIIGVGSLPGSMGWAGNLSVILGTLFVVYPSIDKPMEH